MEKKFYSYDLRTKTDCWLGNVVLDSRGIIYAITDYGNVCYSFGSNGMKDFRLFILKLDVEYFGGKAYQSMTYMTGASKSFRTACDRLAEHILPVLQEAIREELEAEKEDAIPEANRGE